MPGVVRSVALLLFLPGALWAQGLSMGEPLNAPLQPAASGIIVIDFERVFDESVYGQGLAEAIEREGAGIAAENRRIEAELIAEERALTEQREGLTPEEFRALANAFDEKVQRLRREQDAKARALGTRGDDIRREFLTTAQPVLQAIMAEQGAVVILERRAVFAAADAIDVTDRAIERIDTMLSGRIAAPDVAD